VDIGPVGSAYFKCVILEVINTRSETETSLVTIILLKGVVTYTLPVEAFATGIKIGIKRSTFFFGTDQGIKMNSERLISTINALS